MTSLKIHFSQQNIRKISLNSIPDFESFHSFLNEQYQRFIQQRGFTIQYIDEDEDFISVSSQFEWSAMIDSIEQRNFSIFIKFEEDECDEESSSDSDVEVPLIKMFFRPGRCAQGYETVSLQGYAECLFSKIHSEALSLMDGDEQSLQFARNLFLRCLMILPQSSIALYNLACVESLLGNVDEAVVQLKNAINAGYDDLFHMIDDNDFDNIKHTQGFEECVHLLSRDDQPERTQKMTKTELSSLSDEEILNLPVKTLKSSMIENNISFDGLLEKNEFLERIRQSFSSDSSDEFITTQPEETTEESDPVSQISQVLSQMGIYVEREELSQLSRELSNDLSAIVNHIFSN